MCYEDVDPTCAPKSELEEFLQTHSFYFMHLDNFINMEEIMDQEDHIEQTANMRLVTRIEPDWSKNKIINYYINEHRVTLEDSLINFLGFDNKKVLNYLNFDDRTDE